MSVRLVKRSLPPQIYLLVDVSLPGLAILSSRQTDRRRTEMRKLDSSRAYVEELRAERGATVPHIAMFETQPRLEESPLCEI